MTEVKHTPGPFFTSCPHGGTIYVEARLRGSTIQEVAAVGPTETPDQQQANAKLFAAAPELLMALYWALPLARLAMESHRMDRIKFGHNDINGTYKDGTTWVGIYQSEIDDIEFAVAALSKATQ